MTAFDFGECELDGDKVDEDTDASEDAERKVARQAEKGNPIALDVRREGQTLQFTLQPNGEALRAHLVGIRGVQSCAI